MTPESVIVRERWGSTSELHAKYLASQAVLRLVTNFLLPIFPSEMVDPLFVALRTTKLSSVLTTLQGDAIEAVVAAEFIRLIDEIETMYRIERDSGDRAN